MGVKVDNVCNHCRLDTLKEEARQHGNTIIIRPCNGPAGGVEVFEVPYGSSSIDLNESSNHNKYWRTWFRAIPDHCVC